MYVFLLCSKDIDLYTCLSVDSQSGQDHLPDYSYSQETNVQTITHAIHSNTRNQGFRHDQCAFIRLSNACKDEQGFGLHQWKQTVAMVP